MEGLQITRQHLSNPQSNLIPLLMHCTNDAERIADHTANIMRLTKRLSKIDTKLSDVAQDNLNSLWELLASQAENVKLALSHEHKSSQNGVLNAIEAGTICSRSWPYSAKLPAAEHCFKSLGFLHGAIKRKSLFSGSVHGVPRRSVSSIIKVRGFPDAPYPPK